jgi:hypothetical protein
MDDKQINMAINDGGEFWAHEVSINFNPTQFVLDFKCITPRIDPRSQTTPTVLLRHNVVMTDPYHTKLIHELLGTVIKKYEEEFGKITKPKALEKFEKKKATMEPIKESSTPTYFG